MINKNAGYYDPEYDEYYIDPYVAIETYRAQFGSFTDLKVVHNDTGEEEDFDLSTLKDSVDCEDFAEWLSKLADHDIDETYGMDFEYCEVKDGEINWGLESGREEYYSWDEGSGEGKGDLADCPVENVLERYFEPDEYGDYQYNEGKLTIKFKWDIDNEITDERETIID